MTPSPHARPSPCRVAVEHVRSVGYSLRYELLALALAVVALTGLFMVEIALGGGTSVGLDVPSRLGSLAGLGFFAALAVWKSEPPSARAYLWAMPVGRLANTLLKVAAGWLWMTGVIGAYLLWMTLLAVVTDGQIGVREAHLVMAQDAQPGSGVRYVWVAAPWWIWLVPFTGSTIAYLLGSVPALLTEYPWRWVAGAVLLLLAGGFVAESLHSGALFEAGMRGRYGLNLLLTGMHTQGSTATVDGDLIRVLSSGPAGQLWASATLLWGAIAGLAVILAARRHPER